MTNRKKHKKELRHWLETTIQGAVITYADNSHRGMRIAEVVVADALRDIVADMDNNKRKPLLSWRLFR